ncbi:hypothetical protein COV06_03455 [Candidatus Uhrbacteria bacterium CG10_big_fil_rev_8_21_14_0_10_50_16]|uniref:Uncharacterized protein n=1 Tax=Candidatus Uhrbacteria bacterium CG10_big_fil_rev_8_21_14_0_10_50_16 TaxID=1975039 RepID=A0A2H0RLQ8_9BACT|nr:MAG: hypothetical protein COV06_03455 [Candidatus Uhrbacteria bacterium CG10_big_fil_rev_8_21_14_0_10_50_16]
MPNVMLDGLPWNLPTVLLSGVLEGFERQIKDAVASVRGLSLGMEAVAVFLHGNQLVASPEMTRKVVVIISDLFAEVTGAEANMIRRTPQLCQELAECLAIVCDAWVKQHLSPKAWCEVIVRTIDVEQGGYVSKGPPKA